MPFSRKSWINESRKIAMVNNVRKYVLMVLDIILVVTSYLVAILLKNEFVLTKNDMSYFKEYIPYIVGIYLVCFLLFGLYRNMWAYAGLKDYVNVLYGNVAAFFFAVMLDQLFKNDITISTIIFGGVFAFLGTEGIRILYRILFNRTKEGILTPEQACTNALVVGAGLAGKLVINEIQHNPNLKYNVVGLIDDDPAKLHQTIADIAVLGNTDDIPKLVDDWGVDEIIFAIPSLSGEQKSRILNIISSTNARMKTLPNISEIINKGIDMTSIRDVEITDLLGRKEIELNTTAMADYLEGKVILVTGGGGSIGSELCRQIANFRPKQLIIFDIYENNAYDIQNELLRKFPQLNLLTLIGSVRDRQKVEDLFRDYRPQMVFHAAAHKHVPLMETSPKEAIKNNVFGTLNLVRAADEFGTDRFLLISTDKAVNPTNIMGATKRLCEMIIQTYDRRSQHTEYVAVRFGNVLGSNGSVIPLFKRQIQEGGPVTVTHRDITRYFMTIPEAVKLVLTAGSLAQGGEIFVLDMGEPVKIYDLAKNLIRLSGYEPGTEIKIEVTGLRPGEKLYEELLMAEEGLTKTENSLIFIGKPSDFKWERLLQDLKRLEGVSHDEELADEEVRRVMKSIVSTYQYEPPTLEN